MRIRYECHRGEKSDAWRAKGSYYHWHSEQRPALGTMCWYLGDESIHWGDVEGEG